MRVRERYRRLSFFNKFFVWAGVASIVGLLLGLYSVWPSSQRAAHASLSIDSIELTQDSFLAVIDIRIRNKGTAVALVGAAQVEVIRSWELLRTDLVGPDCQEPPRGMEAFSDRTYDVRLRSHDRFPYTSGVTDFARSIQADGIDRFKLGLMAGDSDSILLAEVRVVLEYNRTERAGTGLFLIAAGDQDHRFWLSRAPMPIIDSHFWVRCAPADAARMRDIRDEVLYAWTHNREAAAVAADSTAVRSPFASEIIAEFSRR